jgi:hypothetical protein
MVEVLAVRFLFNFVQILAQVGIGVREAMREIHLVVVVVECVRESQSVVFLVWKSVALDVVAYLVLVVADVSSNTMPAHLFRLEVIAAVRKYAHALVVQAVGLGKVYNVKPNFLALFDIAHPEKVPLSVSIGVDVILEH